MTNSPVNRGMAVIAAFLIGVTMFSATAAWGAGAGGGGGTTTPMPGPGAGGGGGTTPPMSGPGVRMMADAYNTGSVTPYKDLTEFTQKYGMTKSADGRISISQSGTYEGFKITNGFLYITANNVVLRDFYINGATSLAGGAYRGIDCRGTGLTMTDGEITGSQDGAMPGVGATVRRMHIHDVSADCLKAEKDIVIEDCYLHNAGKDSPPAHADGIQASGMAGGSGNIYIRGNRIDIPMLPFKYQATSTMMIKGDLAAIDGITAEDNFLNGGSYAVYMCDSTYPLSNAVLRDNYYGAGCVYGTEYGSNQKVIDAGRLTTENNKPVDRILVGSILARDDNGHRLYDLEEQAGKTVMFAANTANYTGIVQQGNIIVEILRGDRVIGSESRQFSMGRYVPYSEYSKNNLREVDVNGTVYKELIVQPAPQPVDVLQEVPVTLPSKLGGCSIRVSVTDTAGTAVYGRAVFDISGGEDAVSVPTYDSGVLTIDDVEVTAQGTDTLFTARVGSAEAAMLYLVKYAGDKIIGLDSVSLAAAQQDLAVSLCVATAGAGETAVLMAWDTGMRPLMDKYFLE